MTMTRAEKESDNLLLPHSRNLEYANFAVMITFLKNKRNTHKAQKNDIFLIKRLKQQIFFENIRYLTKLLSTMKLINCTTTLMLVWRMTLLLAMVLGAKVVPKEETTTGGNDEDTGDTKFSVMLSKFLDKWDAKQVATWSSFLLLVIHGLGYLAPEKTLRAYLPTYPKEDPFPPIHVFIFRRQYAFWLATALMGVLLFVYDKSFNTVVGFGVFPILIDVVQSIVNDAEIETGISNVMQVGVVGVPHLLNAYLCLTDMKQSKTTTLVVGSFCILRGMGYVFRTEVANKAWNIPEKNVTEFYDSSMKWMGVSIFGYGVILTGLAQGMNTYNVMAYAWLAVMLNIVRELFITKEADTLGANKTLFYSWLLLGSVVIPTLLTA
jgi:hypothetical protein